MARLGANRYGKSRVRLVKVERQPEQHVLRDADIAVALEGEFAAAHTDGDNTGVLPTDTMKNTVYALAREQYTGAPEAYALALGRHFLALRSEAGAPLTSHVTRARVSIAENLWQRIESRGAAHPHAFISAGREQRLARATVTRDGAVLHGGSHDLLVLKTGGSAFADFLHDRFTTLPDTHDRIFATAIRARWRYNSDDADHTRCWLAVRQALLETFADHDSQSVQHTLYAMGDAALSRCSEIDWIRLLLPNRHHLPVDLSRFGLENRNDIFVATTEPYGRIEAVVHR